MQTAINNLIKKADIKKFVGGNVKIPGFHLASVYDMRSKKAVELEREIENHIKKPRYPKHREHYLQIVAELQRLFMVRQTLVENLIATVGRSALALRLIGTTTYSGTINYGALGTGTNTPANSDTQLQTEVFRKIRASESTSDETAFLDFYISKADWDGTAEEFSTVIDGTASQDTGQLFTHALTGGWTKTSLESMTIACQYDIN